MEKDKDFLKWCDECDRGFQSLDIMCQLKRMYERNEMCDFIIKSSDGKEFHVHNGNENAVTLDMFSSETIELILNYVYNGKIEYHKDTVSDVLFAADYLQVESLKNKAIEKLFNFGDKNTLFDRRVVHCIESSIKDSIEAQEFYGENFLEFSGEESFYLLSIESLISILDKSDLNVPSEDFVFNSAMKWMYHDPQNRRKYILNIFPILRTAYLDCSVVFDKILTEPAVTKNGEIKNLINRYFRICSKESLRNKYLSEFLSERRSYQLKCLVYNDSFNDNAISVRIENFIQKSNSWVPYSFALFQKTYHRVLGIKYNNNVYFIQYLDAKSYDGGVILDMDNHSTKKVSFSDSRYERVMTQFKDKIFSFGGIADGKKNKNLVECYSFRDNNVTSLEPMPTGVRKAASVIFNNNIYIIGGKLNDQAIPYVRKYSIYRNAWEDVDPMNYLRFNASAIVYNNRIFVIGGNGLESELNSCEVYDVEQEVWSDIPDMPYKRAGASLSIKNNFLYVVGGVGEEPNKIMKYNLLQSTWHDGPLLEDPKLTYIAI